MSIQKQISRYSNSFGSALPIIVKKSRDILLWNYFRLSRQQGFVRPYFILSFDCDTAQDITVVEGVHARLQKLGIMPVYAVPGYQLQQGKSVYKKIADTGAEFINHGYTNHCRYDEETGTYISSFFYDKLSLEIVREDIIRGHEAQINILGKRPQGFRVPHFGTFQNKKHLAFLFQLLQELGYVYSTSTVPLFAYRNGPVKKVAGSFFEIPVSGCFDHPLTVLDSWGFRFAPARRVGEADYVDQFAKIACQIRKKGGLLNVYADPSQVYNWDGFFECVESMAKYSIRSYSDLLREIGI